MATTPAQKLASQRWNSKNLERRRIWNAEWIKNNRDRYNASKARYRVNLKIEVMSLYSNPPVCSHCGFNKIDGLVLDHVNNDGAKHRKESGLSGRGIGSGMRIYEFIRKVGMIPGLQVLCANCNLIKQIRLTRKQSIKDQQLLDEVEAICGYSNT